MSKHPLPDEVCDGLAVFKELTEAAARRTSPENVSDVLDAVARLMRKNQAAAPSPATPEAEGDAVQSAVNLVCNHLNEHSRELGGAGMIAEAQDYAHAAALVRRYFGDKK